MTAPIDVICFGEILWDIFETEARGEEPIARAFRSELGGSPANVAAGLARLGVRSAVAGGVGRDRMGLGLKRLLEAEHVVTDFVVELPNRTGLTFVVRDPDGEPEFLFYRHASADAAMTADHVTPAMGHAKWGLVGTSTLLTASLKEATERFLDYVRSQNGLVFVDLNVRSHLWSSQDRMRTEITELLKGADVVKASEADLAALAGPQGPGWLEENGKRATWLLTRGERGAAAVGEHGRVTVATNPVRAVDATGAGDAFVAGVLAALVAADARPGQQTWNDERFWARALEAGNMMGAKCVGSVGAVAGLTGLDQVLATIDSVKKL